MAHAAAASQVISEEEPAAAEAVGEEAGVTRVETAAAKETSETEETIHHHSGPTVAGNVTGIGGIGKGIVFAGVDHHLGLEDHHLAETSETATSRLVSKLTGPGEGRETADHLAPGRHRQILHLPHKHIAGLDTAAVAAVLVAEEIGTEPDVLSWTTDRSPDSEAGLRKVAGAAVTATSAKTTGSPIQTRVLATTLERNV